MPGQEVSYRNCISLPTKSSGEVIELKSSFCMSVCVSGCVRATLCTTSTVQDYIVHHWLALCTMMQKGDLCLWEVGVNPDIFHTKHRLWPYVRTLFEVTKWWHAFMWHHKMMSFGQTAWGRRWVNAGAFSFFLAWISFSPRAVWLPERFTENVVHCCINKYLLKTPSVQFMFQLHREN